MGRGNRLRAAVAGKTARLLAYFHSEEALPPWPLRGVTPPWRSIAKLARNIAHLARIKVADGELDELAGELSNIF